MSYTPTVWVDGSAPDIDAANLNKLENGVQAAAAVADAALPTPAGSNGQFLKRVGGVWVPTSFAASDIPSFPSDATKALRGDGTWGATPSNKITTSTLAGGPPASPSDGDIWVATAVDANGVRWMFQYNAGSASSFKWEFIGGAPIARNDGANTFVYSSGAGTFQDPGPTMTGIAKFTLVRPGNYNAKGGINGRDNASGGSHDLDVIVAKNGATQVGTAGEFSSVAAVDSRGHMTTGVGNVTLAANDTIGLAVQCGIAAATITFTQGWYEIVPTRIS